jgi:hypothetical protein
MLVALAVRWGQEGRARRATDTSRYTEIPVARSRLVGDGSISVSYRPRQLCHGLHVAQLAQPTRSALALLFEVDLRHALEVLDDLVGHGQ